MKKLAGYSMLLVFIFLLGGQFIVYLVRLSENRNIITEAIHQGLYSSDEIVFSIDKNKNDIILDGNEFTLNGHRYDIVTISQIGNQIIIYAVNDVFEEHLLANLNDQYNAISSQAPINHKSSQLLENFYKEYLSYSPMKLTPDEGFSLSNCMEAAAPLMAGFKNFSVPPPKSLL